MSRTIYVGPKGNDTNPGTKRAPMGSLLAAAEALEWRGTIRMLNGDYYPALNPADWPPNEIVLRPARRRGRDAKVVLHLPRGVDLTPSLP